MYTWLSSRFHLIRKSPPSKCIVTTSSVSPFKTQATTLAHAPVPQASVSPVPRSQTRMFASALLRTCTNSAFTRRGNAGWNSNAGPIVSMGTNPVSSTNMTAWGLPIEAHVISNVCPLTSIVLLTTGDDSALTGIYSASRIGSPMSTVTAATRPPSTCSVRCFTPASVFTVISVLSVSP